MPDGTCAADTAVVYLREGEPAGAACTKTAPCGGFAAAIDAITGGKNIVRVSGIITNAEVAAFGARVTFLGDNGGSTLRGGGGGGARPMFSLSNGARIEFYDLTLRDSRDEGITGSGSSTVVLVRSKVDTAAKEGISSSGKVIMLQSEVVNSNDMARRGINIQGGGELVMDRCRVADNKGGGVFVADGGKFTVTNSFLVGNKAAGAFVSINPTNDSRFEFNTIVDNASGGGSSQAGGVVCDNPNVSARNNIIYRNTGGSGGGVQKFGNCNFTGSFELAAGPTDSTLKFKSDTTTPKDYHLTTASPASVRNVTGVACVDLKDYDNDSRPLGGGCDLGADEVQE